MSVHANIATAKTVAATCTVINVRIVFVGAKKNSDIARKTVTGKGVITNIFFQSRPK
jgi:hypothetical protein